MERNNKGQFIKTTGAAKYRQVQYKGKIMSEHARAMCIKLGVDKIPKGFVVHHIDENTMNNHIDNLKLMSHSEHNKLHAKDRKIWNKGLTIKDEKWGEVFRKANDTKVHNFFKVLEQTNLLKVEGFSVKEIAEQLKICTRQVYTRLKKFKEITKKRTPVIWYTRTMGYYAGITEMNIGKKSEHYNRKSFTEKKSLNSNHIICANSEFNKQYKEKLCLETKKQENY